MAYNRNIKSDSVKAHLGLRDGSKAVFNRYLTRGVLRKNGFKLGQVRVVDGVLPKIQSVHTISRLSHR